MDQSERSAIAELMKELTVAKSQLILAELTLEIAESEYKQALAIDRALKQDIQSQALGGSTLGPEPGPTFVDESLYLAVVVAKARVNLLSTQLEAER